MGMTEMGTATQYLIDKGTQIADATIPAGYAVEDTQILVLDDDGHEVGFNTVGEVAVKSRYISLGY
jgi:non-ribosomal peptide synthetase component F